MPKRHKRKKEYYYSGAAFQSMVDMSLPPKPTNGYQYNYNYGWNSESAFGKDNSIRLHSSGLFFVKGNNGIVMNQYPYGVKRITILEKGIDGFHYPIYRDWKIFYFHDLPQLVEVEVDRVLYNTEKGQYDDGFYLFRYDEYQKRFIEVIYDEDAKKLVDNE